eukprot:TRINITY_DN1428_c0_g1_i3.p1 TRINITY_DN1428_c0_g1~~TRINITY_DN1428_c0_g1_i3.p1  ORF type:complete len:545 (-),score=221.21 TRINITY_DN1428_c0_g1_i3:160-1794(-)
MNSTLLLLLLGVAVATATIVVKEHHPGVPTEWVKTNRPAPDQLIEVHIAVKQQNLDVLEKTLFEVSDPANVEHYGKHLTWEQVNDLVAPKAESVRAVRQWLERHGADVTQIKSTPNEDFISVTMPVATAEAMLHAEYHHFVHAVTGHTVMRMDRCYSVEAEVAHHIDFVAPSVRFPRVQTRKAKVLSAPQDSVTPSFLRSLYNVGDYRSKSANNSLATCGFLEQYIALSDLKQFFQQFDPASANLVPTVFGPNDETNPGTEASLDIQYVMSVGANTPTTFWSTAGRMPNSTDNEPFLVWLTTLAQTKNAPLVFSVSYGDNENTVSLDYAQRVNVEFQKAGVRGISILFSSGDGGVSGGQPQFCSQFVPTFPAASPYVTAVGGSTSSNPETAASLSSGGFSNYWDRPSYQTAAVAQYFSVAQNLPSSSSYNNTGAGFPDVAAQAIDFNIVQSGGTTGVSGTSCSAPTFSGVVALLNDVRLTQGKSPLGYLNILFYKHPEIFNDITSGNNPGCFTNGFYAAPGWDPVTGLGTPNFKKMQALVSSLP